jgi:hypothetical protein
MHITLHGYKYIREITGPQVIGPKGRRFEPGQGDGFLRTIKIRSTSSFGWEVKPEIPCRRILRHVKDLWKSYGDR